jgi:hypothetical protein
MGKKPAFVRCLSAAVSGQQRPMVPRLAAMIRAGAVADGTAEYPDKPGMHRPSQPRRGVASGEL